MHALVMYDSQFGNTRRIAEAIGESLRAEFAVQVVSVAEAAPVAEEIDLLVVGGPTQGHGASPAMKAFLDGFRHGELLGVPAAAFDTRFQLARWLSGSAAERIAKRLRRAGCVLIMPPESFFVARGREGPLLAGETERARTWGRALLVAMPPSAVRRPVVV